MIIDHSAPEEKSISEIQHAWTFDHLNDINSSATIDKGINCSKKTLESWHTVRTVEADNNPYIRHSRKILTISFKFLTSHFITNFYPSKTVGPLLKATS